MTWKLFGINLIILLFGFILNDPFGFLHTDYSNAEPFLNQQDNMKEIRISSSGVSSNLLGWNIKLIKNKDSNSWMIVKEDHIFNADLNKIEKFLDTLLTLRKFTELGKSREEYGFDTQTYTLEIEFDNGKSTKIELSSLIPQSGGSYISDSKGSIYYVPDNMNIIFNNQDYTYFANRSIFSPLQFDRITNIELNHFNVILGKKETLQFSKDSGLWFLKEDLQIKVNPEPMQDILFRLKSLEIQKFAFKQEDYWKPIQDYSIQFSSKDSDNEKSIQIKCNWLDGKENIVCQRDTKDWAFLDRYNFEKIFSYSKKDFIFSEIK